MTLGMIVLGLVAGMLSGLLGIGGGIIIVPAFVYLAGFTQKLAQGTTLALMVPPIGLLAAWTYYKSGNVDIRTAVLVCLGFFIGGLIGAKFAVNIPNEILKRAFGIALVLIGIHMTFLK